MSDQHTDGDRCKKTDSNWLVVDPSIILTLLSLHQPSDATIQKKNSA